MKILLTGGTGFIGSHTAVALLERGFEVILLDNFSNSSPDAADRVREITGRDLLCIKTDLLDADGVGLAFSQNPGIDAVMHFAGFKAVGESVSEPLAYYHNNIAGTLNLIEIMNKNGVKKLIFSSSATVYRADNPVPYFEDYPLGATNPYGWSKVMIEQILRDVCAANPEWSMALLRYFNPIGAHESGMIGEAPNGIPNNLMPYITKVAAGELPVIHIFGDDYDTPDGTGVRDYIHVMDLAEGHILAMNYIRERKGAWSFNLGTGKGYSVKELIAAFEKVCGKELPKQTDARRAGDLPAAYANTALAKKELGFAARYGIEKMCEDSWRWQITGACRK
ncbi:UDP-glucose 4-epimerase [Clostridia bacterium]|nr:UDP-glucose 4-epimerase [Clostridia bacterium]